MVVEKRNYSKIVKNEKWKFQSEKTKQLERNLLSDPKQFYRLFNEKDNKSNCQLTCAQMYNHYILEGRHEPRLIYDVNVFLEDFDDALLNELLDTTMLDEPITLQEISTSIKGLKPNKSPGKDCIINEILINSFDILGPTYCKLFNRILETGIFPDSWAEGVIIPIHKKGAKDNADNYRRLTLVSCFGKLFTSILNSRLQIWSEGKLNDNQFGFRKNHGTLDAIFALHGLIQYSFFHLKQPLYCAFIDFTKAFDHVHLKGLWYKLIRLGIKGKVLKIIRCMYDKIKTCVRVNGEYSDWFKVKSGVLQGEILSPILFSLFVNDLESNLENNLNNAGIEFNQLRIILLMYADDTVLIAKSPLELQMLLNQLSVYCEYWDIQVNVTKTKIVIFRKNGMVIPDYVWQYNNLILEVVDSFTYLGCVFNFDGKFNLAEETVVKQALKAIFWLKKRFKEYNFNPLTKMKLFDTYISSIFNYGCQIWGFGESPRTEGVHVRFCKYVLGLYGNVNNDCVYGELERYPVSVHRKLLIIKYWVKILNSQNLIIRFTYDTLSLIKGKNWVKKVKALLESLGLGNFWLNQRVDNENHFFRLVKQRLIDCFLQKWRARVYQSTRIEFFCGTSEPDFCAPV